MRFTSKSLTCGRWVRLAALALVGLAFAARVWRLGAQSLWLDEALSVVFARPGVGTMLSVLIYQDLHPPLYYLAMHFWMRVAGESELAARFLSVVGGLPAVPATYVLGSLVFRRPDGIARARLIGLIGAAFLAFSPFMVYYSQEARMYSLLASLGALSSLALWRYLRCPRPSRWWAYVGFTAAMLYTQYFAVLVVAFQVLYLVGLVLARRRPARRGLAGVGVAGALFVPWLPGAYLQLLRLVQIPDFWKGDFQLSFMAEHIFAAFAFGQFSALRGLTVVAVVGAVFLLAALVLLAWRALRVGGGELFVLAYLLVPFAALYALLARDPKFTERYLIAIAAPFYLVLALGLVALAQGTRQAGRPLVRHSGLVLSVALGLALAGASASQLAQVYDGPGYRKDDNRGAVAYVEQHFQSGDVVILMMNTYQSFLYYSSGTIPWAPLQPGGDREGAAASLNQILPGHGRVWMYLWNPEWADPTGYVRQSLGAAFRRLPVDQHFAGVELQLYQIDPTYRFSVRTDPDHVASVNFGNQVQLLGYDLGDAIVPAGQSTKINLYWKALAQLDKDYIVSVRLTDGTFYLWRQDDRPAAFNYPTNYWRPGQIVNGQRNLVIPPGTPPGIYKIELGVYPQIVGSEKVSSGLNVLRDGTIAMGTAAVVGTVQVVRPENPPDVGRLEVPPGTDATFLNDLRLFGSAVQTKQPVPGGAVDVTLWWQALKSQLPDRRIRLKLASSGYERLVSNEPPDSGHYPTSQWTAGEVVVDSHRFVIPPDAPPGPARVILEVWPEDGTAPVASTRGVSIDLGKLDVLDHRRLTTPPSGIQVPVDWRIGSFAQLIGYTLDPTSARPGGHLRLTLYWRALGSSGDVGYTVFSHLLDAHELVWAQHDHPPGDSSDPTSGWTAGEYVVDQYDLAIKPDATPGAYRIEIGMYDPSSGERLSVADGSGNVTGDRIVLTSVQLR